MGIKIENLTAANLKARPLHELLVDFQSLVEEKNELHKRMTEAHNADDIQLLLALGSEEGIIDVQLTLIDTEAQRRDREDGPMTPEEHEAAQEVVMQALLAKLIG